MRAHRNPVSAIAALGTSIAMLLTGCDGIPVPFRAGTGNGSYQITVHLADAGRLARNAEVKAGDITVGSVTGIAFDNWTAKLTVGLDGSATMPANAEARLGQKSLLGAEYLELSPPSRGPGIGRLREGDDIPLQRTGQYPATEELLAALSLILNQGGLSQLQTVTTELNAALSGHETDARQLIGNLGTLVSSLNARRDDIATAIDQLNRLSGGLAEQTKVIDEALRTIPPALDVLERQRTELVRTLEAVATFSATATPVINQSREDLAANLRALQPVLGGLADSGRDLTESMPVLLTFPFPANTAFPQVLAGDYGNLFVTVNLDPQRMAADWSRGLTVAGLPLLSGSSLSSGMTSPNPLTTVLTPPPPGPAVAIPGDPLGALLGGGG